MIANVELHINNFNNVTELYLFERLRYEGLNRGGYFDKSKLSHHEKYKVLPLLESRGWVTGNKIIKYREVVNKEASTTYTYTLSENALKSLNNFKGNLVAILESYCLHYNYKNQRKELVNLSRSYPKSKWRIDTTRNLNRFTIKKFSNTGELVGRVANSVLASYAKVSEKTISRWRKYSENKYELFRFYYGHESSAVNADNTYYSKKNKKYLSADLRITTKINIFTHRRLGNKYKNNEVRALHGR